MFTDFNTFNQEAFMVILANIWDKWVSKEGNNAARKVGITSTKLSVEMMLPEFTIIANLVSSTMILLAFSQKTCFFSCCFFAFTGL